MISKENKVRKELEKDIKDYLHYEKEGYKTENYDLWIEKYFNNNLIELEMKLKYFNLGVSLAQKEEQDKYVKWSLIAKEEFNKEFLKDLLEKFKVIFEEDSCEYICCGTGEYCNHNDCCKEKSMHFCEVKDRINELKKSLLEDKQ